MEKERFSAPRWPHEVDAIKIDKLNRNPGQAIRFAKGRPFCIFVPGSLRPELFNMENVKEAAELETAPPLPSLWFS